MTTALRRFRTLNRTISVPHDLEAVTTRDRVAEVEPREVGMTREGVLAIWAGVERYYRTGMHPAISVCIRRRGKVVLKRAIGHARGNGPLDGPCAERVLVTPDTPICQFSASKAITAMLVHHLEQRGLIHLMDPVSWYIPEFAAHGKGDVTIFHVLSHQSGFPQVPADTDVNLLFDNDRIIELLCALKPKHRGGHDLSYHAITGGFILGELVRRVTGKTIRDYLHETFRVPLGFKYFDYGLADESFGELAVNYRTGLPVPFPVTKFIVRALGRSWSEVVRLSNDPRFYRAVIPSANIVATADEMSQFFQLLLNGGELHGTHVFDPLTVRRATLEAGKMRIDSTMVLLPMRYSAGLMLGASPFGMFGPHTDRAFGHWGFINSFSWADPDRDIAASVLNTGKPFFGPHLVQHFELLGLIAKHCAPVS